MKCNQCGLESEHFFANCPNCGSPMITENENCNRAADMVLAGLKDKLFLVLCILSTVACGLGVFGGSFDVIGILTTIFLWLVYSNAKKGVADADNLRNISGTLYARYVLNYVAYVMIAVVGILLGLVMTSFRDEFEESLRATGILSEQIIEIFLAVPGVFVIAVCLVAAVFGCVLNYFGIRKIHLFAKSVYQGIGNADISFVKNAESAKLWLWIYGMFGAIDCFGSLMPGEFNSMSFLSGGCASAGYIVAAIMIRRYIFAENKE